MRSALVYPLLASLSLPAAAQSSPPWAVEAPAAAGARFGLGLDWYFERLDSLRIASSSTEITLRDLATGREQTQVLDGDAELLNRKFDLRWELESPGFLLPIALPAPRALRLFPTVILRASSADFTLDILDRTRREDSTSLRGRGQILNVGLDVTGRVCVACPWFTSTRYDFTEFAEREVDRAPAFTAQPLSVTGDEVRLGARTHEFSTRVGYLTPGGRTAPYAGVRVRRTEIDIEDMVQFTGQGVETELDTKLRLETNTVLGFTGVDMHLWGPFFARAEAAVGEENRTVQTMVMYLPGSEPLPLLPKRAKKLSTDIRRIHAEYREGLARIARLTGTIRQSALLKLLQQTEDDLLEAFTGSNFGPMRDYIIRQFDQARGLLVTSAQNTSAPMVPALVTIRLARQGMPPPRGEAEGVIDQLLLILRGVRRWVIDVCFQTDPTGAEVSLYRFYPPPDIKKAPSEGGAETNDWVRVWRGTYAIQVKGPQPIGCRPRIDCPNPESIDLVVSDRLAFDCSSAQCSPIQSWRCQ